MQGRPKIDLLGIPTDPQAAISAASVGAQVPPAGGGRHMCRLFTAENSKRPLGIQRAAFDPGERSEGHLLGAWRGGLLPRSAL